MMILQREHALTGLANHLVNCGLLEMECAKQLASAAKTQKISFITYLVKNTILMSETILASCEKIFGLPVFDLENYDPNWLEQSGLNKDFIQRHRIIPLNKTNNLLYIGLSDPTDQQAIDAVIFHTGMRVNQILIDETQLTQFIENFCQENHANQHLQLHLLKQISLEDNQNHIQENIINYDEPLVKFVDNIILHAFQQTVTDIHIEPYETCCRIRYRQHGILHQANEIPNTLAARVVTRLKVMAKLDIAERRLPQDGRFQLHAIDVRINTCPTLFGEKIVLRLLNAVNALLDINELGFTEAQKNRFIQKISQPQGMILVTGPTGSGKTVTLYSALNYLNQIEKNISTVEDPVEIRLSGINQVNINSKIGLHFSTILRTFLRQDPDIIMVGEIRDLETANIAIQAAQTGHLVLSTLHTNSAAETITRLQSIGVFAYNLASSLSLIIAQRLLRQLCPHCKQPDVLPTTETIFFRAHGCQHCTNGYIRRIAIYEFLPITENLTKLIISGAAVAAILRQAKREGFVSLKEAGLEKAAQGITSLAEINRVLQL